MLPVMNELSIGMVVGVFLAAAAVICIVGIRLTRLADVIADRTGFGEAMTGAVLLGASTSLPGTITSVWSAWGGYVDIAVSNAVGGIAAQTAFLVFADLAYRRANLEHAAASLTNVTQLVMLMIMLTLPLLAHSAPPFSVAGVHPVSLVMIAVYVGGLRMASATSKASLWKAETTDETRFDEPGEDTMDGRSMAWIWVQFAACAVAVSIAGWTIAQSGVQLTERGGVSQSVVGALMTAVATSLPELVTTLAAVRRGALQLAVGGIIGGNTFDVLFLSFSDISYRPGSLFHQMQPDAVLWIAVSLLMSGVLLLGLLRRERHGLGNIGFESMTLLGIYSGAIVLQIFRP